MAAQDSAELTALADHIAAHGIALEMLAGPQTGFDDPSVAARTASRWRTSARLLDALPGREPVVVFTASRPSYLSAGARTAFLGQLDELAHRRPVAWVFAEAPGLVATIGLSVPALRGPLAGRNGLYLVGASLRDAGRHDDSLIAMADPYLRWLAPAQNSADDFQWLPAG